MARREQTVTNLRRLAERRKALGIKPKRPRARRLRIAFPSSIQRQYRRVLAAYVAALGEATEAVLVPMVSNLVREFKESAGIKNNDAWYDDIDDLLDLIDLRLGRKWSKEELAAIARGTGRNVNSFVKSGLERNLERVLGVNILSTEPWLKDVIEAFSAQNVNLITSVKERYLGEVRTMTFQGVSQGLRAEEISSQIRERLGVAESRADLIARDQVSKLVSQTNMLQQRGLGVTKYEWSTSLDERVRQSHADLEGTTHEWNEPPTVDGEPVHPGQAINCRCAAIPILEDLIEPT